MNELTKISNDEVDTLEKVMFDNFNVVECPLIHRFTKGLYIREIFMPKGSLVTSRIHKTQHPFVISQGVVSVWINEGEELLLEAPHTGITEPGTRRVLYIHEDTVWTTFHPNPDEETLEQIEERIIEKHDNLLINKNENLCLGFQQP